MSHIPYGKTLVVGASVLLCTVFSIINHTAVAAADSYNHKPNVSDTPALAPGMLQQLSYASVCSNASANTASWKVTNPNVNDVTLVWRNGGNTSNGNYTATASSTTTFTTTYSAAATNQNYSFTVPGYDPITLAASSTACAAPTPPVAPCVDGNVKSNLIANWNGSNTFTVHTVHNALLCSDVTLYVSDYILPASYDGTGFGDPTSYPQNVYKSYAKVLAKGTDGSATLTIELPPSCNNSQEDLYYAPEITLVGQGGHGEQFIAGGIIDNVGTCEVTPPVTPTEPTPPTTPTGGMGGGDTTTTPVTPTPVATAAVVTTPAVTTRPAASLVDTGVNIKLVSIIAAVTAAAAILVGTRRTKDEVTAN